MAGVSGTLVMTFCCQKKRSKMGEKKKTLSVVHKWNFVLNTYKPNQFTNKLYNGLVNCRVISHKVDYLIIFTLGSEKLFYLFSQLAITKLEDCSAFYSCKKICSWFFSDMVVDLAHLVVQLLCAVKQSHDKDVCHGERTFTRSKFVSTVI